MEGVNFRCRVTAACLSRMAASAGLVRSAFYPQLWWRSMASTACSIVIITIMERFQNITRILMGSRMVRSFSLASPDTSLMGLDGGLLIISSQLFLESPLEGSSGSRTVGFLQVGGYEFSWYSEINNFSIFLGGATFWSMMGLSATLDCGSTLGSSLNILRVLVGRRLGCTAASFRLWLGCMDWFLRLNDCWMDLSCRGIQICTSWSRISLSFTGGLEKRESLSKREVLKSFSLLPLRLGSSCLYIFIITRSVSVLLTALPLSLFDYSIRLLSISSFLLDGSTPKQGSFSSPSYSSETESRLAYSPMIIGFLLLAICSTSMLFNTMKQQMKIMTTTTKATPLTASPKMSLGGKPLALPDPKISKTMMATRAPVPNSSKAAKSILRAMIFSTKSSYFESL